MGQHAIFPDQRHDIRDRPQRRQRRRFQQKSSERLTHPHIAADRRADRPGQFESHARAAEVMVGVWNFLRRVWGQPGVHDGVAIGQMIGIKFVMIRDDQINAALPRDARGRDRGDTAIDGDDQLGPTILPIAADLLDRLAVQAVAFIDAMRDVVIDDSTERFDRVPKNARGRDAVHIVIAIDDDLFLLADGAGDAGGGDRKIRDGGRLVHFFERRP